MSFAEFLLKLRPAPFASFVASVFGMNKRRLVRTDFGTFFINPVSVFGTTIVRQEYEPPMRHVLEHYLSPGAAFVDLGTNEGYFSVMASRLVGPSGSVLSVEPQTRLQDVIATNLRENGCFNVTVRRCLVSDVTGTLRLSLAPAAVAGSSSLYRHTRYPVPTEEVPSFRLADLLDVAGITRCDLMKVDIEGAEYDVFMSAADLLSSGRIRHIALEFHPEIFAARGLATSTLHEHLLACGYTLSTEFGPSVYSFSA